jgi:hypothetical protein
MLTDINYVTRHNIRRNEDSHEQEPGLIESAYARQKNNLPCSG